MPTSGVPTEAQVQDQWRKAIGIISQTRTHADGLVGSGKQFEGLGDVLRGDYTTEGLAAWMARYRASLSTLVGPGFITEVLSPCIFEYARVLQAAGSIGSGQEDIVLLKRSIFEHFVANSLSVLTRDISYDPISIIIPVSGTATGDIARVTADRDGFDMEACHVEKKIFRCVSDQNSGAKVNSEVFEVFAETRSPDDLEYEAFGSGSLSSTTIVNSNAGTGTGGSLLRNSSFSSYDTGAVNHFTNWELVTGTVPTQTVVAAETYSSFNGETLVAGMKVAANMTIKQTLANMRTTEIDPNVPHFLRVMVNGTTGSATGATVKVHIGGKSVTVAVATINAATNWYEIVLPLIDGDSWLINFNKDDFDVRIEVTGLSGGYLVFDDMILVEMTPIDGTFWILRQNDDDSTTLRPWLLDDTIEFSDTNIAGAGVIQFFLFRSGLGYLPSSASPTFLDP